jgi:hypothetical protein
MEDDPLPTPPQQRRSGLAFVGICFGLICLGSIIGYAIPVENIEQRNRYAEAGRHFLNIIDYAIVGAAIGVFRDGLKTGFPRVSLQEVTWGTVLVVAAMGALLIPMLKGYMSIVELLHHMPH